MQRRPWLVDHPHTLLLVGGVLVLIAFLATGLSDQARALIRELGGLIVLAWFALVFIERPLREETARSIRETATQEISRVQNQTVERLLRGWLPPAHFAMLQRTTLQPFMREDMRYRIRLVTGSIDGRPIPAGYIGEVMEYRYRVRNLSESSQDAHAGMVMSKECAGVLDGIPHMTISGEFDDGMPAFQPYSGSGEEQGEYVERQETVKLSGGGSVNVEIHTKELRLPADRETLICPMPANGMVVEFEYQKDLFEVTGSAWQEPGALKVDDLIGIEGAKFTVRGPILPGTSLEIKWRPLPPKQPD